MITFGLMFVTACNDKTNDDNNAENDKDTETENNGGDTDTTGNGGETDTTELTYKIVSTGQTKYFNNNSEINAPSVGDNFYGQDASYESLTFSYTNNGDGTITDNNTGLMWQKTPEVMTHTEATNKLSSFSLANHTDWRLPTVKELYSLINFSGKDVSGQDENSDTSNFTAFIDVNYFDFEYSCNGDRLIDSQYLSSTFYKSTTMNGDETIFGVNFADGRIKGYPKQSKSIENDFTVMYVRGAENYGGNNFDNNDNGTITDNATDLMWMQDDNGYFDLSGMTWQEALNWAENLDYAGYSDWRLPNAKELHSIVDYTRTPDTTNSATINSLFNCSKITVADGTKNYPFYWSSTTHENEVNGSSAVYFAFGEALGFMENRQTGILELLDVHGAGAQRSDPKKGDPDNYSEGHGPQGDVVRIYNYVRLVRDVG